MKRFIFVTLVFFLPSLTAYGEYTFEVIDEKRDGTMTVNAKTTNAKENKGNALENYRKVVSNDDDVYIARSQLTYNRKREKELLAEIDNVVKQLDLLPKIVKDEYPRLNHMLQSTDNDAAENTWISFDNAYKERQKWLNDRLLTLKSDLLKVQTRISKLKLDVETQETINNISNPFTQQSNKKSSAEIKSENSAKARDNLMNIAMKVALDETRELLSGIQHSTFGLCEFSCGRKSCYVCNLLYGKVLD